ncbi:hypothetical protein COT47_01690, partial [Candidatus Woesearchaeota archaeon CG08_land_8_20_14_0_20_43_7]
PALRTIKESWKTLRKNKTHLGVPFIFDVCSVLLFYLLLWFFFAPIINNILNDILITGQAAQNDLDIASMITFDGHVNTLLMVLGMFISVLFIFWSLIQGYLWRFTSDMVGKEAKTWPYIFRFSLVTFIFIVPATAIMLAGAKLTFGHLAQVQLVLIAITGIIISIMIHFMLVSYTCITIKTGIVPDIMHTLGKGVYLGSRYLAGYLVAYLFLGLLLFLIDNVLNIFGSLNSYLYLISGIILVFTTIAFFRIYLIQFKKNIFRI